MKKNNFNVPDFIYVPAEQFHNEDFEALNAFLDKHRESFKVIARSAHPQEELYKSGTFDSVSDAGFDTSDRTSVLVRQYITDARQNIRTIGRYDHISGG